MLFHMLSVLRLLSGVNARDMTRMNTFLYALLRDMQSSQLRVLRWIVPRMGDIYAFVLILMESVLDDASIVACILPGGHADHWNLFDFRQAMLLLWHYHTPLWMFKLAMLARDLRSRVGHCALYMLLIITHLLA